MRLTVLNQTAKGLPESGGEGEDQHELRTCVIKDLERIKWYLWHGNVFQALNELQSLKIDLDAAAFENKNENSQKLLKGVEELHTYIERNQEFVPNYGERYRNGERIASGFVEMNSESLPNVLTRQWRIVTGSKTVNPRNRMPETGASSRRSIK